MRFGKWRGRKRFTQNVSVNLDMKMILQFRQTIQQFAMDIKQIIKY